VAETIYHATESQVRAVLAKRTVLNIQDFAILISPAAASFLEQMAQRSATVTRRRFGNTVQLFAPLYLSNECQNICTYCGFSLTNKMPRKTLSDSQILEEAEVLRGRGIEHVLLVTGEAQKTVGTDYLLRAIKLLQPLFVNISIEVQPLEEEEYRALIREGLYAVLVYQETYNKDRYHLYHPKGRKSNFDYRLDTPDRLGRAGVHKIGLGALLGLEDWRVDSFFTGLHLDYLQKKYWQTKYSVSFPRMRPFEGGEFEIFPMTEKELLQLICAWRLFKEDVEISVSTRERAFFRDHVAGLGVTSMSAGSSTEPGGYSHPEEALEQFSIDDNRSVQEVAAMLRSRKIDPVYKDWFEQRNPTDALHNCKP